MEKNSLTRWHYIILSLLFIILVSVIYTIIHNAKIYLWFAKETEHKNRVKAAIEQYYKTAKTFPKSTSAPESLFRVGELQRMKLKDNNNAILSYQRVMTEYPNTKWAVSASEFIEYCYDFFPVIAGYYWEEGDSQTFGKIYRSETLALGDEQVGQKTMAAHKRTVYAGRNVVTSVVDYYYHERGPLFKAFTDQAWIEKHPC